MQSDELEELLARVDQQLMRAGTALLTFWDEQRGNFIRETVERDEENNLTEGRTSTARAITALIEFVQFLRETPNTTKCLVSAANGVLTAAVRLQVEPMASQRHLQKIRGSSVNGVNMFTDAHLLVAATFAARWICEDARKLHRQLDQTISPQNIQLVGSHLGGRVHDADDIHDFVTLHTVMGLDTFRTWSIRPRRPSRFDVTAYRWPWTEPLVARVRRSIVDQLGHERAGVTSRFDPGELAFSTTLLDRLSESSDRLVLDEALRVVANHQSSDGAWPTSRIISYGGKRLLHVASTEIALALASVARRAVANEDRQRVAFLLPVLERTLHLIETTFNSVFIAGSKRAFRGWANDRARWSHLVESWATAIIVSFLARTRNLLLDYRQLQILNKYSVEKPSDGEVLAWPHFAETLQQCVVEDDALAKLSDPTKTGNLREKLLGAVVRPIMADPVVRPSRNKVSFLVPGPPGSRKTSLLRHLAAALRWPLITLSPPDFLRHGLDGFEQSASGVFADLQRLRRAVVLFDECEDFIKARPQRSDSSLARGRQPPVGLETRTIGAFITSGMLPRLQALHDRQWILFAVATNSPLGDLDTAAIRAGRFDFTLDMHYPCPTAQRRYLKLKLRDNRTAVDVNSIVRQLEQLMKSACGRYPTDSKGVAWSLLDEIVEDLTQESGPYDLRASIESAWNRAVSAGPPRLGGP